VPGPSAESTDREFVSLVDRWLDELHDAAQNIVGSSAAATAICHEVLASLRNIADELPEDDRARIALLLATRERSLQHLEAHGWHPPAADGATTDAGASGLSHGRGATRHRVVLAHAAATVIGVDEISVLDLHDRHGVDATTLADALSITADAVPRRLAQLRAELADVIAAHTLWNEGRPACDELATELDAIDEAETVDDVSDPIFGADRTDRLGDAGDFDGAAFRVIELHRRMCATCTGRHRALVDPADRFLTSPVAPLLPAIRSYLLAMVAHPPMGWTKPSATAPREEAATELDDDEIDALWESTTTRPPRSAATTRATSRSARVAQRRTRRRRRIVVVAAVVAGALTLLIPDNRARIVTETPPTVVLPDVVDDEPPVRPLTPLPPIEPAVTPVDPTSTATTSTTTPDTTPPTTTSAPTTVP
jgi:hypothetical protein